MTKKAEETRHIQMLGKTNEQKLVDLMMDIEEFVFDHGSPAAMTLRIPSSTL